LLLFLFLFVSTDCAERWALKQIMNFDDCLMSCSRNKYVLIEIAFVPKEVEIKKAIKITFGVSMSGGASLYNLFKQEHAF